MIGELHRSKNLPKIGPLISERIQGRRSVLLVEGPSPTREQMNGTDPLRLSELASSSGASDAIKSVIQFWTGYGVREYPEKRGMKHLLERIVGIEDVLLNGLCHEIVDLIWRENVGGLENMAAFIRSVVTVSRDSPERQVLIVMLSHLETSIDLLRSISREREGVTALRASITPEWLEENSYLRSRVQLASIKREIDISEPELIITLTGANHIPQILELSKGIVVYSEGVEVILTDFPDLCKRADQIKTVTNDSVPISYL